MCIIVGKPAGVEFPSFDTLENCFESNPDGAGFMYARDKRVYIKKGFMTYEDFMEALVEADIDSSEACVMHFRIGTQGGNTPENCHPFPVPCTEESLKELECETQIGMAHNGIISLCSELNGNISDTMIFDRDIVTPLFRLVPSFMQSDDALAVLESTCKSKLCFIDGLGDMVTVGDFIENDGVLYSNTSYLSYVSKYSTYKTPWYESYYEDDYGFELYDACEFCNESDECEMFGPYCMTEAEAKGNIGYKDSLALTAAEEEYLEAEYEL